MVEFTGAVTSVSPVTAARSTTTRSGAVASVSAGSCTPSTPSTRSAAVAPQYQFSTSQWDWNQFTATVGELEPSNNGVIPGEFISVSVTCVDTNGDPFTDGTRLMSTTKNCIPGNVDSTGEGQVFLLKESYQQFTLVRGEADGPDAGITNYTTDGSPSINPLNTKQVTLVFKRSTPTGGSEPETGADVVLLSERIASSSSGELAVGDDVAVVD